MRFSSYFSFRPLYFFELTALDFVHFLSAHDKRLGHP
jgi:hypothetical protein